MNRIDFLKTLTQKISSCSYYKGKLTFSMESAYGIEEKERFNTFMSKIHHDLIFPEHEGLLTFKIDHEFYDDLDENSPLKDLFVYRSECDFNAFFDAISFPKNTVTLYRICLPDQTGIFSINIKLSNLLFPKLPDPKNTPLDLILDNAETKAHYLFAFSSKQQLIDSVSSLDNLTTFNQKVGSQIFEIKIDEKYVVSNEDQCMFDNDKILSMKPISINDLIIRQKPNCKNTSFKK